MPKRSRSTKTRILDDGLYVDFVPNRAGWQVPAGLFLLSDKDISEAYTRAHPFFLERAATLKGHDSNRLAWKDVPSGLVGKKNIVAMTRRPSRPGENHDQVIVLPSQFSGFLDSCRSLHRRRTWQNRFGWYRVQRLSGNPSFTIGEPAPVADISTCYNA